MFSFIVVVHPAQKVQSYFSQEVFIGKIPNTGPDLPARMILSGRKPE
jgi:hypothetical protein